jgi:coenzyme PQQ precursor peptide PqqA
MEFGVVSGLVEDGLALARTSEITCLTCQAPDARKCASGLEPDLGPKRRRSMAWTTPVLVEICIGLEINGYLPAEI